MTNPEDQSRRAAPESAPFENAEGGESSAVPDIGFALGSPGAGPAQAPDSEPRAESVPERVAAPEAPSVSEAPPASDATGTLPGDRAPEPVDIEARARDLARAIARDLVTSVPPGWQRLTAVFACTVVVDGGHVVLADEQEQLLRIDPPDQVLALVREFRDVSAVLGDGPWWRLLVDVTAEGNLEIDYDYGDEPFPDGQLFAPEAYRADLEVYPRERVPLWLAAYIGHEDRQSRPPGTAMRQARADRAAGVRPVLSEHGFPDLPVLWARWAVMSAAFVAVGSDWGPRLLPSLGWFEGSRRSGSTLYLMPGGRAVLSGGVWNAPALEAAYGGARPMPSVYAGAPDWIANPVLNPRAGNGLLSFCYWWEGGRWYRGDSPAPGDLSDAVPGIWSADTVAQVILSLFEDTADASVDAVARLVAAAESGTVTRRDLVAVFGDENAFDSDAALYQLTMAGVAGPEPEPLAETDAVRRVLDRIREGEPDIAGYPVDGLRADRIPLGWMVYAPTAPGEIAVGRAIFYVADDGVVERSSSSIAPSVYLEGFERRYRERAETALSR